MKYRVDYMFFASFSHEVEADSEDEAIEIANEEFSPYSDEALEDVEFSTRPCEIDVEEV